VTKKLKKREKKEAGRGRSGTPNACKTLSPERGVVYLGKNPGRDRKEQSRKLSLKLNKEKEKKITHNKKPNQPPKANDKKKIQDTGPKNLKLPF